MTRSAQAISTRTIDFPGNMARSIARDFLSLARARTRAMRLKNPFNLNLLRGGDQRRQGRLAERNSDFWSFLGVR